MTSNQDKERIKCEENIIKSIQSSPLIRIMLEALKSAGCPLDIRRHISCEQCQHCVSGGYDPEMNQIIICQNTVTSEKVVQRILTHEMIHMFDYCSNHLDFRNLEHLACTEIRAANLAHCSFFDAFFQTSGVFNIKQKHKECVKSKALSSMLAVRNDLSRERAKAIVEGVFNKCYVDLEPIGRRFCAESTERAQQAYEEYKHFFK